MKWIWPPPWRPPSRSSFLPDSKGGHRPGFENIEILFGAAGDALGGTAKHLGGESMIAGDGDADAAGIEGGVEDVGAMAGAFHPAIDRRLGEKLGAVKG